MAPSSGTRTRRFGPDDSLLGVVTPSHGQEADPALGAVIWGMGVAQVQTARRLGRAGVAAMQIRIGTADFYEFDRRNALYDSAGVSHCRAAIDELHAVARVDRFLLIGNCAHANLCFNAALVDARVAGIVLTNPHFSESQILSTSLHRKFVRAKTWKRLLNGKSNLKGNLGWIGQILFQKITRTAPKRAAKELLGNYHHRADVMLPAAFDDKLRELASRGVKTLILYSQAEDSLRYMEKTYMPALQPLQEDGQFSLQVLPVNSHAFYDDAAAMMLNDRIMEWVRDQFALPTPRERMQEAEKTARISSAGQTL
jgi:hypothetical protein